jgi:hypothetical protein
MVDGKMHQTTLRFSPDLWQALEEECRRLGVSVAQYLREAAIARLAYTAARRGLSDYEMAFAGAGAVIPEEPRAAGAPPAQVAGERLQEAAGERVQDSMAVTAQSEMARMRSRQIREHSERLRRARQARHGPGGP